MSGKEVLAEFRKQRKLFVGVKSNDVQALLEGMSRLIGRSKAIGQIVNDVYAMPHVKTLRGLMVRGGSAKAGTVEEVVGVGFHIIQNCKGHITTFCSEIGIRPPHAKASRQEYVDSIMNFYIRNAFDFIEEKLEESVQTESKQKTPRRISSKIEDEKTDESKTSEEELPQTA